MSKIATQLEIVFENDDIIAINKPHGLLVHKTNIAKDAKEFAIQKLRDQVGYKVYPAHRIDRKTSGILLFSKSKKSDIAIQALFREKKIEKSYLAIVRGFLPEINQIDYAIGEKKKKDALTHLQLLSHNEIPVPFGKFRTSRYSLIRLYPITGRHHQLRKHMAHIFHPIIGDRPHGCNKQNKLWKEHFGIQNMMLHAEKLKFIFNDETILITASLSNSFNKGLQIINSLNPIINESRSIFEE